MKFLISFQTFFDLVNLSHDHESRDIQLGPRTFSAVISSTMPSMRTSLPFSSSVGMHRSFTHFISPVLYKSDTAGELFFLLQLMLRFSTAGLSPG